MPTPTDLVTDLPADFEVFGQAVDSTMADLKGGTSGQILSKNSNTDMDFVWTSPNPGDITGVSVTSPLTGGGTSGDVTVGIQSASTSQSGAVQLTDSTSSTSTTTAATPNAVKSAFDLAGAAIPKSTVTTNGDLIYGTGSSAVSRIGIGTSGQVLQVSGGIPAWGSVPGATYNYSTWTPTLGNVTLGNGSLNCRFVQIGKFVHATFQMVFGSTTNVTGTMDFTFPTGASSCSTPGNTYNGTVRMLDSGVANYTGMVIVNNSNTWSIVAQSAGGSHTQSDIVRVGTPFSWSTNDEIQASFTYQAV